MLHTQALAGTVNITNGVVGDGHLDIDIDDFGSYGATGGVTSDDQFQPPNTLVSAPTFTTGAYVFITTPSDGKQTRVLLSDITTWQDVLGPTGIEGTHSLARTITSPNTLLAPNAVQSAFEIAGSGPDNKLTLGFALRQKLVTLSPGVTMLDQSYVITNTGTVATDLVFHAHWDADLSYAGSFDDDIVAAGRDLCYVYTRESGSLSQSVALLNGSSTTVPLANYYGCKDGVTPGLGLPTCGAGTDVQIWDNLSLPTSWRNNISTGGYDTAVESGTTPGTDTSMGLEWRFSLAPGASVTINPKRVYGTEDLPCGASADLAIAVTDSPDPVTAGQTLTYTVNVTNNGTSDATAAKMTHTLPAGVTVVSATGAGWTCSASGQVVTCTDNLLDLGPAPPITITTTAPNVEGSITATATISSTTTDPVLANNSASATTTVTGNADLAIAVTDAPDPVTAGAALTYTVNVTNNGPQSASSVSMSNTLPAGVTFGSATGVGWSCAAAGQIITCVRASLGLGAAPPITITTTSPDEGGSITNTATISSDTNDPVAGNNSTSTTTTVTASANLAITVSDSPDPVSAGATLTYTVGVTNNGPSTATNLSMSNTLPAGVTFVSAAGTGWSCAAAGQTVSCTRASLASGAAPAITITSTAPAQGGSITDTATITTTTSDPVAGNNTASTTTIVTASADLAIAVSDSPDPVAAGATLIYTIDVTNVGPSTADTLTMSNTLPAGVTFVSASGTGWTCGVAGQVVTCTRASLTPGAATAIAITTTAPAQGGSITDTATITSATSDPVAGNNSASATTIVNASADLSIAISDSPDPVTATATLTYTVSVTNNGPSTAATVSMSNTLPAGVTFVSAIGSGWSCAAAGQVVTCTRASLATGVAPAIAITTKAPSNGGSITDTATITAATSDPVAANNSASATTTVVASADLHIAVTDSPDPVAAGAVLTYTVDVVNLGPSTADALSMANTLPAGATFVSASGSGWTCSVAGQVVTCTRASLASGAAPSITITTTAPAQGGSITDTATISAATADPVTANNSTSVTTTVTASADLAIAVSDAPDPVTAGAALTYTVDVTNLGPSTATTVSMANTLPAGVTFVSASGTGWTCSASGQVITCVRGSLAEGAAPPITITTTAPAGGGSITDTATISAATSDPVAANNSATTTTTVTASADLAIAVTDSPDPVTAGATLTYSLAVTNLGPSTASTITVTDTLDPTVTFISAAGTGWTCSQAGGVVSCTRSALAAGAAPAITISVTAPAQPTTVTNTASVDAATADPVAANNTAVTTTNVTASAELSIAVSDAPDPVTANAPLTYTIGIANAGPSTADSIVVTNTLPAGTTFVSASGAGWACSASGQVVTCTRTSLGPGTAPAITITATAPAEGGSITDTASVSAATADPVAGNNTASATTVVTASADLAIAISDSPDPVTAGGTLTYTIDVTNLGPSTAATLSMANTLGSGVTFISAVGTGWTCSRAGQVVTCGRPSLATGAAPAITITTTAPVNASSVVDTATISAATVDPVAANNSATATTTVTASADLTIAIADAPDPVAASGTLAYTLTVTNLGPSTATSVGVTNTLDPAVTFISASGVDWTCSEASGVVSCTRSSLAPGPAPQITITVTAPAESGTVSNTASVDAATADPVAANNSASATTTVTASADLAITLTDVPDPVGATTPLTYNVGVTNLGPSTAAAVSVSVNLDPAVAFTSASGTGWTCVAAGQIVTCTRASLAVGSAPLTIVVTTPANPTTITTSASVDASTTDPVAPNNVASATTAVTASADLAISVTDAPDPVTAATALVYTIGVTNLGPSTATAVEVTNTLPAGVAFTSASGSGWACSRTGQVVTCTTDALGTGASPPITIVTTAPNEGGTIVDTASVTAGTADPVTVNNSASATTVVTASADLAIALADAPDPVIAGATLVYTIDVTNLGPSTAETASVSHTLPAGVTFVSATGTGWTCSAAGQQVNCTHAGLALGAAPEIAIVTGAPAEGGTIDSSATIAAATADPVSANNTAATSTVVTASADLSIAMTAAPDPVPVGGTVTYTITVTNVGPSTAE
ncbi:MAG: DUF11 domain-containing protein, partial [Deltaproteobacteria bacterium]|nr:DUF11 domain-containing protein [Deltaproteobacteria bacterium]